MTTERDRIQARADAAAQQLKTTRIDLAAFLALDAEAKAIRWRQWSLASKQDVVIQQLTRLGYEWSDALVAEQIAKYDAKWLPSDLDIPAVAAILVVAKERSDDAQRHGDYAGAAQLNRLRVNLQRGAGLSWSLGDLLVQSVNNPGKVYSVSRRGCTCVNGQKGQVACWHIALFDLLLDMAQTAADTADSEADAAAAAAERAALGRRLCAARSRSQWAA